MGISLIDSSIFGDMFGSESMKEVFSEKQQIQGWLDFEAALARAEATCGLIPNSAADIITSKASADLIDVARYKQLLMSANHPIMPLIELLAEQCGAEAGEYVHWGATTQDVMDTGLVLQLRSALKLLVSSTEDVGAVWKSIARKHRSTIMPGRTHAQHAVPITFGYKVAVWLDELSRAYDDLIRVQDQLSVGQFGGAAGTLASLGANGERVRQSLMSELHLSSPSITWHVSRDRLARLAFSLVSIAGVLRRAANEIIALQRTEVAEVEEPFYFGKIGSSTMPHKRNPAQSELIWTLGSLVFESFDGALVGLGQMHERDMAVWQVEWDYIPRMCVHAHRMLEVAKEVFSGMTVNEERMRANLDLTQGAIFSESVMMALAGKRGRQSAHEVVYSASMEAAKTGVPLQETLEALLRAEHSALPGQSAFSSEVAVLFGGQEIVTGAETFVDSVCDSVRFGVRESH